VHTLGLGVLQCGCRSPAGSSTPFSVVSSEAMRYRQQEVCTATVGVAAEGHEGRNAVCFIGKLLHLCSSQQPVLTSTHLRSNWRTHSVLTRHVVAAHESNRQLTGALPTGQMLSVVLPPP
jgi:hypothetical protein